jgi:hypothetical protein
MAKINISNISSGFSSTTALNNAFDAVENELNNKVLYRDNPSGEPNQMENDLDMNGNDILNVNKLEVNGQDIAAALLLGSRITISTLPPEGGVDGDIWFRTNN